MTTPSPDPSSAYIDVGVIGFVFGEMWRRGVLTARDRRWITLACLGSTDAGYPIETHVWAALQQRRHQRRRIRRVRSAFRDTARLAEGIRPQHARHDGDGQAGRGAGGGEPSHSGSCRGRNPCPTRSATPGAMRRTVPCTARTTPSVDDAVPSKRVPRLPLRGDLDEGGAPDPTGPEDHQHLLLRRRRRGSETRAHLEAALRNGELTFEELQELVVHFAVYVGLGARAPTRRPSPRGRPAVLKRARPKAACPLAGGRYVPPEAIGVPDLGRANRGRRR